MARAAAWFVLPGASADSCEDADPLFGSLASGTGVVAVADGLGGYPEGWDGHTGGYHASRLVRAGLAEALKREDPWLRPPGDFGAELTRALRARLEHSAGDRMASSRLRGTLTQRLATTLAGALVSPGPSADGGVTVRLFWIGDSRVYLLDSRSLRQLTIDDQKSPSDAFGALTNDSPMSQFLSASMEPAWRVHAVDVQLPGDGFLIACTDGCFAYWKTPMQWERALVHALAEAEDPEDWGPGVRARVMEVKGDDAAMVAISLAGWKQSRAAVLSTPLAERACGASPVHGAEAARWWRETYKPLHDHYLDEVRRRDEEAMRDGDDDPRAPEQPRAGETPSRFEAPPSDDRRFEGEDPDFGGDDPSGTAAAEPSPAITADASPHGGVLVAHATATLQQAGLEPLAADGAHATGAAVAVAEDQATSGAESTDTDPAAPPPVAAESEEMVEADAGAEPAGAAAGEPATDGAEGRVKLGAGLPQIAVPVIVRPHVPAVPADESGQGADADQEQAAAVPAGTAPGAAPGSGPVDAATADAPEPVDAQAAETAASDDHWLAAVDAEVSADAPLEAPARDSGNDAAEEVRSPDAAPAQVEAVDGELDAEEPAKELETSTSVTEAPPVRDAGAHPSPPPQPQPRPQPQPQPQPPAPSRLKGILPGLLTVLAGWGLGLLTSAVLLGGSGEAPAPTAENRATRQSASPAGPAAPVAGWVVRVSVPVRAAAAAASPLADTIHLNVPLSLLPGAKPPPGWLRVPFEGGERWIRETERDKTGRWPVVLVPPVEPGGGAGER